MMVCFALQQIKLDNIKQEERCNKSVCIAFLYGGEWDSQT